MKRNNIGFRMGCLSAAVLAYSNTAFSAGTESGVRHLEEVVVTAQRRAQALEEVPISITTMSSEELEKANITSFIQLGSISPGTQISHSGPFYLPSIRGISSAAITSGQENNVATYIDGIYQPNKVGLNFDFANIESVEILKGPQGTLFGRNATGGAILVKTKDPSQEFEGSVSASYGRYADTRFQGYVNVPVTDAVAVSLSGYDRQSDGYVRDISGFDAAPHEESSVRAKVKVDFSENFSAVVGYNYIDLSDPIGIAWAYTNPGPQPYIPGNVVTNQRNKTSMTFAPTVDTTSDNYTLSLTYDMGDMVLTTKSSYTDLDHTMILDVDGSTMPIVRQDTMMNNISESHEINLTSDGESNFSWVAGVFYFSNEYELYVNKVSALTPGGVLTLPNKRNALNAEALALYFDGSYDLSENLSLTVGVRWSTEDVDVEPAHMDAVPANYKNETWSSVTPRIALTYNVADRSNFYASFSQGFKSGTFDASIANPQKIEPEEIDAYEVGFKTVQPGYRLDVAAYFYSLNNLQDSQTVASEELGGGLGTNIANVGDSEIKGLEVSLTGYLTDEFTATLGAAYTDAEYKKYPAASNQTFVGPPAFWGSVPTDWAGNEPPRAPELTANLNLNYLIDAGSVGNFELNANLAYVSENNPTNSSLNLATGDYAFRDDAYTLVNLSATWNSTDDSLHLTLFGKNVTDEKYHVSYNAFSTFGQHEIYGEPATYGVRIGYDF